MRNSSCPPAPALLPLMAQPQLLFSLSGLCLWLNTSSRCSVSEASFCSCDACLIRAAPRRRRPLGRSMALSEGHGSSGSPGLEAESVVLRGARGPSGMPSSCSHAAAALDAWLLQVPPLPRPLVLL